MTAGNFLENIGDFRFMALIGGVQYPIVCALSGVIYSLGSVLFLLGYSDTSIDVKYARFKKGGAIKYFGLFSVVGCCVRTAFNLIGLKTKN